MSHWNMSLLQLLITMMLYMLHNTDIAGSQYEPTSLTMRKLVGFWWFFSIVMAATYTGNLIAVLAVPKTVINNMQCVLL